jgi:hypothetical protein
MVSRWTQYHPPPPSHTLSVYSVRGGGGWRVEPERRLEGQHLQNWVENTNMTDCTQEMDYLQSINSDEHLAQSPFFTGQYF